MFEELNIPDSTDLLLFQKIHHIKLLDQFQDKTIKSKRLDLSKLPKYKKFNIIPFHQHQLDRKADGAFTKYPEKLIANYSRIMFSADQKYAAFVFSYFIEHDCLSSYRSSVLVKKTEKGWKICYRGRD